MWEEKTVSKPGTTVLDRVHQAMILFANGRGEALKRFLVDDGVGSEPALWKLAQALSALSPPGSQEKRWVDGVLARKRVLGCKPRASLGKGQLVISKLTHHRPKPGLDAPEELARIFHTLLSGAPTPCE